MPAEITTGSFCASWWGVYHIVGSTGVTYHVSMNGGEGPAFCDCPAFKFAKGPEYDRTCKHIARVHQEACLWNCQWHDGNQPIRLRPHDTNLIGRQLDDPCPNCNGATVPVRIAV